VIGRGTSEAGEDADRCWAAYIVHNAKHCLHVTVSSW